MLSRCEKFRSPFFFFRAAITGQKCPNGNCLPCWLVPDPGRVEIVSEIRGIRTILVVRLHPSQHSRQSPRTLCAMACESDFVGRARKVVIVGEWEEIDEAIDYIGGILQEHASDDNLALDAWKTICDSVNDARQEAEESQATDA